MLSIRRIKPRFSHMMLLTCAAFIVIYQLLVYLEKQIDGNDVIQSGTSVALTHQKSFLGDYAKTMDAERVESTNNTKQDSAVENQQEVTDTSTKHPQQQTHDNSLGVDADFNLLAAQDINNDLDFTLFDELVMLNRSFVDKPKHSRQVSATKTKSRVFRWNGEYEQRLNNSEQYRRRVYSAFYRRVHTHNFVNCSAVVDHDDNEITKAKAIMRNIPRREIPLQRYARTVDCKKFRSERGYIEHPLSQIELDFPLAFGMIVYRDVEQAERLLRSIYRPHNVYCIHLDIKMKPIERMAMEKVAGCLDNVFVANTSINVEWGNYSVLEAELICMKALIQHKRWRYYINLTGQEFPLKTNKEIVSILRSLQGANIVDGTWIRARERYFHRWTSAGHPPPHKIRPIKGAVHVAVNRHFVDFALNDYRSRDFLEWLKKTQIPDETFFASLNHNPRLGINGSFLGEPEEYPLKPSLMRYKNWELGHSVFVRNCEGKYVRHICVLGVGDLNQAYNDIGLFVNKLNIDFEYLALDCLEKILHDHTWSEYVNDEQVDTSYYERLDYVRKQLVLS